MDEIAVISVLGYQANRKSSIHAAQWLEWMKMSAGGDILHRRNGRKHRVGKYFVDGTDKKTETIYAFNGCVFDEHPECTVEDDHVPFSYLSMK